MLCCLTILATTGTTGTILATTSTRGTIITTTGTVGAMEQAELQQTMHCKRRFTSSRLNSQDLQVLIVLLLFDPLLHVGEVDSTLQEGQMRLALGQPLVLN